MNQLSHLDIKDSFIITKSHTEENMISDDNFYNNIFDALIK